MQPRAPTHGQARTHLRQSLDVFCAAVTQDNTDKSLYCRSTIKEALAAFWALYYSWRGCASCWQLGATFIIAPLCCQKHDGFQAFVLEDNFFFFMNSDFIPFHGQAALPFQTTYFLLSCEMIGNTQVSGLILGKMYVHINNETEKENYTRLIVNNHLCYCQRTFTLYLHIKPTTPRKLSFPPRFVSIDFTLFYFINW